MDHDLLTRLIIPRERDPNVEAIVKEAIRHLPNVPKSEVDLQDSCGVCLTTYEDIFQDVEEYTKKKASGHTTLGKDEEEEEFDENAPGLTKVEFCGHTYCRKDLIGWIRQTPPNNTCPLCRHPFIELPVADDESSDGGEYIPGADDYDDDATDGYSDMDPLGPSEQDELYTMAREYRRERAQARALREEFAEEIAEGEEQERQAQLREEFAEEIAGGEEEERQGQLREEFAEEIAEGEEEERQAQLRDEFAREIAEDEDKEEEERMAVRDEFAREIAEDEERERLDDLRAEFADIIEEDEAQESAAALEDRYREALTEEWESLRDHFAQIDSEDMEMDDAEVSVAKRSVGSDALMDVYASDSSSDLDYEPEDYLMSDTDTDTDMSSDFDYSVEELDCVDNKDAIAIHADSSNDSLLALVATEEEKMAPSASGPATSTRYPSSSRARDTT